MKKILFRTDANEYIGMGHVMRCITIAKAMRDMECLFVVSDIRTYELIETILKQFVWIQIINVIIYQKQIN